MGGTDEEQLFAQTDNTQEKGGQKISANTDEEVSLFLGEFFDLGFWFRLGFFFPFVVRLIFQLFV